MPSAGDILGGLNPFSLEIGGGGGAAPVAPLGRSYGSFKGPVGAPVVTPLDPWGAIEDSIMHSTTKTLAGLAGGRNVGALVQIGEATFNEPTDIDMLVAKVRFAYRSLG